MKIEKNSNILQTQPEFEPWSFWSLARRLRPLCDTISLSTLTITIKSNHAVVITIFLSVWFSFTYLVLRNPLWTKDCHFALQSRHFRSFCYLFTTALPKWPIIQRVLLNHKREQSFLFMILYTAARNYTAQPTFMHSQTYGIHQKWGSFNGTSNLSRADVVLPTNNSQILEFWIVHKLFLEVQPWQKRYITLLNKHYINRLTLSKDYMP